MEIHLYFIGILLCLLALLHVIFPKYFDWKNDLEALRLINREMMKIHTFFIALVVFGMGVLCLTSANELCTTPLGRKIAWGLGIFWSIRLVVQFWGYSSELWRGKMFETWVHIVFTLFWTYLSSVFFYIAI